MECNICPFVIASKPRWADKTKEEMLTIRQACGDEWENFMDDRILDQQVG